MSLFVLAVVTYLSFIAVGYPLVGVAAYLVCCLAGLAYHGSRDRPLFDERDQTLRGTASRRTLDIIGTVAVIASPAGFVYYTVIAPSASTPSWLSWLGISLFLLYVFYGVVRLYTRYER
ncbi:hypothetical protein HALLA_20990 (plasmid) [Halostagnicola larsenii XH-48]|uniref:DUF2178 domain-containing protein n=1 Tax=Halostagnicola larsenii XH-48 TaxID=797299 RepID=W0JZL2_9EURY|nr:hypothetical protein [Halostagnicola larsenii]AHG02383.1 hypothetical protein HALLA_20990 [Halostagnicola larsenii XH-48]